jgi:hypothetical protein
MHICTYVARDASNVSLFSERFPMNSTNWAAEGNKQSKQQTCLSLALFVPFRNPARTMHVFSLAFSCVGPLCFWFALHVHHPRTIRCTLFSCRFLCFANGFLLFFVWAVFLPNPTNPGARAI